MSTLTKKNMRKVRLASRVRYKLRNRRNDRLRLSVFVSNKNTFAQIIDDKAGTTLVAVSTLSPEFKELKNRSNIEAATKVGELIAIKAKSAGISEVVFDRGSKLYHGKVKALADAARISLSF